MLLHLGFLFDDLRQNWNIKQNCTTMSAVIKLNFITVINKLLLITNKEA